MAASLLRVLGHTQYPYRGHLRAVGLGIMLTHINPMPYCGQVVVSDLNTVNRKIKARFVSF